MQRYVRRDWLDRRHGYSKHDHCQYCGRFGSNNCAVAVCMLCGTAQCHGNGGSNGQCGLCYSGLLPGWSGSDGTCTYKNCGQVAVARGRGRKKICKQHAAHQGLWAATWQPDKEWTVVD